MYYFNYRDELYHYGRKGMKWGENIFTKGLDALNNKIKAADAKATGNTSSSFKIPSYSEYKANYGGKNTSTTSKTSTSKKTSSILNMDQRKIDDRARVLASAGNAKSSGSGGKKGRGGKGKKGGGSKSKASKQATAKKEETKAALEEAKAKVEEAKATTTDAVKTETKSNVDVVDYSDLSASEIASKAMNGEFASLDEMKEKLGDRYEDVLNELKKQLGIEENADDESVQKAYEEKIQTANGEATIKRLYQKIFPNTKKE